MKTEIIKAIFTNLLFLIGVVLLIVGFSRGLLTVTRLVVFDKYPLEYYAETRCDIRPVGIEGEAMQADNACLNSIEYERQVKLTDDIVNSVTMIVSGVVLTLAFRRFIFSRGIIKRHPKVS